MLSKTILQKLTENTRKAFENAFWIASNAHEEEVKAEHLLIGIWQEKGSLGMALLQLHNFQNKNTAKLISGYTQKASRNKKAEINLPLSIAVKKVLKKSASIASQYSHKYIGTEHVLYSLIDFKDERIDQILQSAHIDKKQIKKTLLDLFRDTVSFPDPMSTFGIASNKNQDIKRLQKSILSYFCTNLTDLAKKNKIEPVIGREQETSRLIHILNRKTKNNPILIGEPGVGKTAIVQGLALRIVKGEIPESLRNKEVLSLDIGSVIAGTMLRGDLEARLKEIVEEIKQIKNLILFIDEIHNIVGAGSVNGAMDTANLLKPALSQGDIQCIGATTLEEYHRFIERDRALERRFQPILIKELTEEQSIKVIKGLKPIYEHYHRVVIPDQSITAAVTLSSRYINDRYLPDKAIDVIDETAARLRSVRYTLSPLQKKIESLKQQLKSIEDEKEKSVIDEEYQDALSFKQKEDKIISKLSSLKSKDTSRLQSIEITERDIRHTIAVMTGIPLNELKSIRNINLLLKLIHSRIIGQEHVINTIHGFIKRANAGITNPSRPWGSFIFLGPTGVGKTELAKVLAEELFGMKESFIKLDMSEFMEKHNVSRLIGSPPGYVGFEEGGKLTEKIKRNPYSLILFDEIEKAHPDVFNLLLQILEDGILTDARGNQVNFKNTLIIMTSNIGTSEFTKEASKLGFNTNEPDKEEVLEKKYEEIKEKALKELKSHLRPELLNRIDQTLVFKPLSLKEIEKIVDLEVKKLTYRVKNVKITFGKEVKQFLAEKSFNPTQGARHVRQQVQTLIEEPIADVLLKGHPKEIFITTKDGKIITKGKN